MKYDPILCMMVDDSVKTKDVNKNEGFKIHKAEIRGDKLYLTYTDLLYGGKETESFTKSEAKGFLNDPWNTWEGNTKSVMMKFVKDSKTKDGLDDPEKNAGYEMKKEGQYFKVYKNGKLIAMKSTEEEARREASRHRAANDFNTIDKAIRSADGVSEIRKAIGLLKNAMSVLGPSSETQQIVRDIQNVISKLENID